MSAIRILGFVYLLMFVGVASMSYIPSLKDDNGLMFGLFSLDLYDDLLHLFSGLWAGTAALLSTRASTIYFRMFGALYFLDGVMGLFLGSGYLDFGIFTKGVLDLPISTRFFANLPHLIIGGVAFIAGFALTGSKTDNR